MGPTGPLAEEASCQRYKRPHARPGARRRLHIERELCREALSLSLLLLRFHHHSCANRSYQQGNQRGRGRSIQREGEGEGLVQAAASHLLLNSSSTTFGSARVERSPRSFSLRAICRRIRLMIFPKVDPESGKTDVTEEESEGGRGCWFERVERLPERVFGSTGAF
ncbi:hypothetical protein EYF80_001260 [Liparis tanakae]|uniref:Uncharacterized protein n=1 Tax=Liparis tanakae TaxID=230148 RepID=A0A4Z2JFT2_9TELE|nr:hypothetical protein EYF80_001260 [Liparis tanakae]